MAKEKFIRNKPHLNVGTIGHVGPWKETTLTAAITKALAKKNLAKFTAYDQIDKAPEERERGSRSRSRTWSTRRRKRHYAHVDCPWARGLHQEHDHWSSADGRGGAGGIGGRTEPMPADGSTSTGAQVGVPSIVVYLNKVDMVAKEDAELLDPGGVGTARTFCRSTRFPGDTTPDCAWSALRRWKGAVGHGGGGRFGS